MYCLKCGSQMADGSKFCIACGAKVENSEPLQESASQVAAASAGATAAVEEPAQTVSQPVSQPAPKPVQEATPPPQPTPPVQASQPKPEQPVRTQPAYTPPQQQQPARPAQQGVPGAPQQAFQTELPKKPEKITPLPVWKYIGIFLIMSIPLLGFIMLFVWAFGSSFNKNTRNYARAFLIMLLISVILMIVGYFTVWANIQDIMSNTFTNMQFPTN